jgi:4-amino-4-deoxy-L-arabinose transferase-like glycosyltransferase
MSLNTKIYINPWLLLIAIGGLILKVPAFFQELPGFQFCDETIFLEAAYQIYLKNNYDLTYMTSGGLNYYIPVFTIKLIGIFSRKTVEYIEFIKYTRIALLGFAGLIPTFLIFAAAKNIFKIEKIGFFSAFILTFSPYILANNRIVYPDSILLLFSATVLYFISRYKLTPNNNLAICLGVSIAGIASIKLSGLIFFVPIIGVVLLNNNGVKSNTLKLIHILMILIIFILFFYYFNRLDINLDAFLKGIDVNYKHYKSGHVGLESNNGLSWYLKISLFTIFGILGSVFILIGVIISLKK